MSFLQPQRVRAILDMEKPFLVLSSKHWLTGVEGSANSGIGGIFKLAPGVSSIRGVGTFSQVDVGLLQAGPTGANGGSEVVDNPISGAREPTTGITSYLWVLGSQGHIYLLLRCLYDIFVLGYQAPRDTKCSP